MKLFYRSKTIKARIGLLQVYPVFIGEGGRGQNVNKFDRNIQIVIMQQGQHKQHFDIKFERHFDNYRPKEQKH